MIWNVKNILSGLFCFLLLWVLVGVSQGGETSGNYFNEPFVIYYSKDGVPQWMKIGDKKITAPTHHLFGDKLPPPPGRFDGSTSLGELWYYEVPGASRAKCIKLPLCGLW